jgi:hypothetical protein
MDERFLYPTTDSDWVFYSTPVFPGSVYIVEKIESVKYGRAI